MSHFSELITGSDNTLSLNWALQECGYFYKKSLIDVPCDVEMSFQVRCRLTFVLTTKLPHETFFSYSAHYTRQSDLAAWSWDRIHRMDYIWQKRRAFMKNSTSGHDALLIGDQLDLILEPSNLFWKPAGGIKKVEVSNPGNERQAIKVPCTVIANLLTFHSQNIDDPPVHFNMRCTGKFLCER